MEILCLFRHVTRENLIIIDRRPLEPYRIHRLQVPCWILRTNPRSQEIDNSGTYFIIIMSADKNIKVNEKKTKIQFIIFIVC